MIRQNTNTEPNIEHTQTLSGVRLFLATPQKVGRTEMNLFLGIDANDDVVGILANIESDLGKMLMRQFASSVDDTVILSEVKGLLYDDMTAVGELAGQRVNSALYRVESYCISGESEEWLGTVSKGRLRSKHTPVTRYETVTELRCMSCQPLDLCDCDTDDRHLCVRSVSPEQMSVLKVGGRTMTTADCPVCTFPMWRVGGAIKTVRVTKSAADYRTSYGPPAQTYCLSCRSQVAVEAPRMVEGASMPHFVANCPNCGGNIGTPPSHSVAHAIEPGVRERNVQLSWDAQDKVERKRYQEAMARLKNSGIAIGSLR